MRYELKLMEKEKVSELEKNYHDPIPSIKVNEHFDMVLFGNDMVLTQRLMAQLGIDDDFDDAVKGVLGKQKPVCVNLETMLFGLPETKDRMPVYVITTEDGKYGATVIGNKQFMDEAMEKFSMYDADVSEVCLIPSSVHEWLMLPVAYEQEGIVPLKDLIGSVNKEFVKEEDVLSDHPWYYSKLTHEIYPTVTDMHRDLNALHYNYGEYMRNEEEHNRTPDTIEKWVERSQRLSRFSYEIFASVNAEMKQDKGFEARVQKVKGEER